MTLSVTFESSPVITVGNSMNIATDNISAMATDSIIKSFHAFSLPNLFSIQTSNLSFSYSSGWLASRTSAEYISIFVPCTREEIKLTTPLTRGTFAHLLWEGEGWVFMWMFPSGSLTAMAVFLGPLIIIPSIMACPPIEVGQASFKNIFFRSIFLLYRQSNMTFLMTCIKSLLFLV